jgi:serine/threonine-protein phosphatase 4 catalytic subunit
MTDNLDCDYNAELDKYIEQLKSCKYIQDDRAVKKLCEKAKELLMKEENVIYLNAPITVSNQNYLNKI